MNQLEIQFQEDAPDGVFTIRRPFSVMTAYYVPRSHIKEAKNVKGINRYGIYCLYGNGRIYIGQTRNGIERIAEHTRGKQFWDEAVLFLADPIHFNLNIISGLERHAIEMAMKNSPYEVENKSVPQYETVTDFEQMQVVTMYEEISFIMAFLGIKNGNGKKPASTHLLPQTSSVNPIISKATDNIVRKGDKTNRKKKEEKNTPNSLLDIVDDALLGNSTKTFHTKKRGVKGLLKIVDGKYVVISGSVIDYDFPVHTSDPRGIKIREEAMNRGFLTKDDNGLYILKANCRFTSPSAAAVFVLGGSQNGKVEWVDENNLPLANWLENNKATGKETENNT